MLLWRIFSELIPVSPWIRALQGRDMAAGLVAQAALLIELGDASRA